MFHLGVHEPPFAGQSAGVKLDAGKPPVVRGVLHSFPRALEMIAHVSASGADKYSWDGWLSVPDGVARYTDAMGRHLIAEGRGRDDPDSGQMHAAHTAWNALARLELMLREATDEA